MIELGTGFHPELTGQENVLLNASIHGLSRAESLDIYDRVVAYSGLQHFMDVPIKNYSSGMHMRLGFSIAATLDPDVLLLDEIFAVGDEDFQKQCVATIKSFEARGKTIVFVSHSSTAIQAICDRACLLDRGRLLYDGTVDGGLTEYRRLTAASPYEALGPVDAAGAGADGPGHPSTDADLAWHRLATGGRWLEEGAWVFDFLRRQGLRPDQYVLDVGCGSLSAARLLLPVHAAVPLLGVREEHRAVHRRRAHRAAPCRRAAQSSDTSSSTTTSICPTRGILSMSPSPARSFAASR